MWKKHWKDKSWTFCPQIFITPPALGSSVHTPGSSLHTLPLSSLTPIPWRWPSVRQELTVCWWDLSLRVESYGALGISALRGASPLKEQVSLRHLPYDNCNPHNSPGGARASKPQLRKWRLAQDQVAGKIVLGFLCLFLGSQLTLASPPSPTLHPAPHS
jgi:hypothetical protein